LLVDEGLCTEDAQTWAVTITDAGHARLIAELAKASEPVKEPPPKKAAQKSLF
jgi:hypothetical protein